ncbi:DUF1269 domain-containing protein [Ktedonobacter racemifer]|uniref:Membrane protein of uknown function UCP014873 n=1 Tax=Ktedonobacter racemifer DSM 44963 TaxID=485913 RepID=D6TCD6_KTERA|nr:DUF1269 domain-containing protein [Ktedonobacter racemifer]EFH89953.1 membrane protein of uknown function UCP014873 [Ktedonobacter racemifer DSM 44963]
MAESRLIALVFDGEQEAEQLWLRTQELQRSGLIPPGDAAIVIIRLDGQVIVQQVVDPTDGDAFNAQTWEYVIKTLLSGWGEGIDDWFVQQVKQHLLPGTSALFLLVDPSKAQEVVHALRGYPGKRFYSVLSTEDKARIRAAAGQA